MTQEHDELDAAGWRRGADGMRERSAARVVLLDAAGRVLLVRGHDVDLPERRGRLVVGTHRQEAVLDAGDTWFDHVRDSRLFVPVLLAALALLLVLGAYVLGRAFTAAVGG